MIRVAAAADYRAAAERRLPPMLFHYVDGGSYAERTAAANIADFGEILIRQRVLADASKLTLGTTLFGREMSLPLALAPVGMAGMFAKRGEVQAARAAEAEGVPFCLSTVALCPVEEVARAVTVPPWFQLYMLKDRGRMAALLDRAAACGAETLFFTVDLSLPGARYRDVRTGFASPVSPMLHLRRLWEAATHPHWAWHVGLRGRPHVFGNMVDAEGKGGSFAEVWAWARENFDPSAGWHDLAWVRDHWKGPIVLKGILDPADAQQAVAIGADGIVVSNHGGRQLDDVSSTIRALPAVAEAVAGRIPVLLDGGVRSGLDILKALALGASACLVGRAWAFALAAGGEAGVRHMIGLLRQELTIAMALSACTDVADATPDLVRWR